LFTIATGITTAEESLVYWQVGVSDPDLRLCDY